MGVTQLCALALFGAVLCATSADGFRHFNHRLGSGNARVPLPVLRAHTTADIRIGMALEIDNEPLLVQHFQHVKPGKGAAFVRTKLKSLTKGTITEKTFRAGTTITPAPVKKSNVQVVYCTEDKCVFQNPDDDTRHTLLAKDLDGKADFLTADQVANALWWGDKLIDIELPPTVELEVVDTDPPMKTNSKPATLETGLTLSVPGFVVNGDRIIVNTSGRHYVSRA